MLRKIILSLLVVFVGIAHAESDDPVKQFEQGVKNFYGVDVEKNYPMAYSYFLKSAEQGDVDAQFNLSVMYRLGLGILKDDKKAFEWNMKAALQGDEDANFNVCLMYRDGIGVEQSADKALEWYTEHVTNDGYDRAASQTGMIYMGTYRDTRHYKKH